MGNRTRIGQALSKARKEMGLTQQQMALKSGINKSTISEIENGNFTGSFDIFERLMSAAGLQFDVVSNKNNKLPAWNEIDALFDEDD